jgi:hypothetical protein
VTGRPAGLQCPGCEQLPYAVLGGGTQAFCNVLTWDPTMTLEELASDMKQIDLSGWSE